MDERMTIEQARNQIHAFATAKDRNGKAANYYVEMNVLVMDEWWKAIDAHLTQPAQAVDVGAIREVIAELTKPDVLHAPYEARCADKLTRAIGDQRAVTTITPSMVHEAEAHVPCSLKSVARWEWIASYLNAAMAKPNKPCECCGVTPAGHIFGN